jgi:hypothetical protein
MPKPVAVLIATSAYAGALQQRLGLESTVAVFSDSDFLQVADAILADPPRVVALDPTFAATARGASLVAQLRNDTRLRDVELRVLLEDEANVPLILTSPQKTLLETSRPLDRAGTRRADRVPMNRRPVTVNGEAGQLVDLSLTGAQVIAFVRLRPNQALRLTLPDGTSDVKCQGTVAWAVAAPVGPTVQYRGGIEFTNPDTARLQAICARVGIR